MEGEIRQKYVDTRSSSTLLMGARMWICSLERKTMKKISLMMGEG